MLANLVADEANPVLCDVTTVLTGEVGIQALRRQRSHRGQMRAPRQGLHGEQLIHTLQNRHEIATEHKTARNDL